MKLGVLLTNVGTPEAPTPSATRKYLAQFLSDSRVVELPKLFWLPILYGFILPFRARRSAKLYQKIWTTEGSPLRNILEEQVRKLRGHFCEDQGRVLITAAMRYGTPSIESAIHTLCQQNIQKLLLFPLYPQYSAATTASTFDELARVFRTLRVQPELHVINDYYNHIEYIDLISKRITNYYNLFKKTQKLLFSFHGLPQRFVDKGDIYEDQCQETARLIAARLNLSPDQWGIAFQSRLGRAAWLKPYTDHVLKHWAVEENITSVTVVCPGFSADCLETLEEIDDYDRKLFLKAGGKVFQYVPALNAQDDHVAFLARLIGQYVNFIDSQVESREKI